MMVIAYRVVLGLCALFIIGSIIAFLIFLGYVLWGLRPYSYIAIPALILCYHVGCWADRQ